MAETFEQLAARAYETAMGQELRPQDKAGVLKVLAAFRDELAKGREPIGWLYTDAYGTHYTDEKREWYDAVGIEEVIPLYTHPFVAAPSGVPDFEPDAKRLALELECLLLDCKDMAAVSKWWDSAHEALEQHRAMLSAAPAAPAATATVRYDLSPAEVEGAIRDKLIEMGWTPPGGSAPAGVPDGWKLVPAEPTAEQQDSRDFRAVMCRDVQEVRI